MNNCKQLWSVVTNDPYCRTSLKLTGAAAMIWIGNYIVDKIHRKIGNYPPGPSGLPLFGSFLSVAIYQSKFWEYLASSAPISLVYFFRQRVVVFNDPDAINHVFRNNPKYHQHVDNRAGLPATRTIPPKQMSIIALRLDEDWHARRQLVHKAMQRVLNHKYIDSIVLNTFVPILFNKISRNTNNFTNSWQSIRKDFDYFQFYLLFYSLFGDGNHDNNNNNNNSDLAANDVSQWGIDEKILEKYGTMMINYVHKVMSFAINASLADAMGITTWIWTKKTDPYNKLFNDMSDTLLEWTNKHTRFGPNLTKDIAFVGENGNSQYAKQLAEIKEKLLAAGSGGARTGPTFVIDTYLEGLVNPKKYAIEAINVDTIMNELGMLFIGGMETTTISIESIVVHLAKYIQLQNDIYNQLLNHLQENNIKIQVNSNNKCKTVDTSKIDFTQLHLLRAFIWEGLRVTSAVPLGLTHYCDEEITIDYKNKQYTIPKNSTIMMNVLHTNTLPKYWDSESRFDISNWLNEKTNKFEMNNKFAGFGIGRRDCAGKHLAINIIRRLVVLILINFNVYGPNGASNFGVDPAINIEFKQSFTRSVDPTVPVMLIPRM